MKKRIQNLIQLYQEQLQIADTEWIKAVENEDYKRIDLFSKLIAQSEGYLSALRQVLVMLEKA